MINPFRKEPETIEHPCRTLLRDISVRLLCVKIPEGTLGVLGLTDERNPRLQSRHVVCMF